MTVHIVSSLIQIPPDANNSICMIKSRINDRVQTLDNDVRWHDQDMQGNEPQGNYHGMMIRKFTSLQDRINPHWVLSYRIFCAPFKYMDIHPGRQ